jgi:hypothetical protein
MILQELLVPLKLDDSGFHSGIDRAVTKGSFFGSFMGNIATNALSGITNLASRSLEVVGDFMGDATEQASDLAESVNAVNVVFEDGADAIHNFSRESADMVGLSGAKFRQLASVTGAFLTNLGMDSAHAADQTIELTKRAADMASVFNTDVSSALQAIQSGLKGEFDPLEQFGVKLNMAAISAKAMEMGLAGSKAELTDSMKAQAALALIMEQTNKLAGDFLNTSDGLANSQRILAARFDDIKAKIGDVLLPILEEAHKQFISLIDSEEFQEMIDGAIENLGELSSFIVDNLPAAFEALKNATEGISMTWETRVAPVARELIRLYENINTILDKLSPGTDKIAGKFTLLGIVQRISVGWATMVNTALAITANILDLMNDILERVISKWHSFESAVWSVIGALARLTIPWWLTPGSPTPLENGLRGIGSAMGDLNKNSLTGFSANFNASQPAPSVGSSIDYQLLAKVVATELAKSFG